MTKNKINFTAFAVQPNQNQEPKIQKTVIAEPLPAPEIAKPKVSKQPKKILVGIYLTPATVLAVKKISYETGLKANTIYEKFIEVGMNYKQY